jgi:hypothetical protein
MDPDFERYRRELGEEKVEALLMLCFHRANEVPRPFAALREAARADRDYFEARVKRAFEEANGNFDSEKLCEAIVRQIEGPGVMPGLVEVRGGTGEFWLESRNIQTERGGQLVPENINRLCVFGLTIDPEFYFENILGSGVDVLLTVDHVSKLGLAFCEEQFAERIEVMRGGVGRGEGVGLRSDETDAHAVALEDNFERLTEQFYLSLLHGFTLCDCRIEFFQMVSTQLAFALHLHFRKNWF